MRIYLEILMRYLFLLFVSPLLLPLTLHATSPLLESLYAPLIKQNLCSSTEECKKKRYIKESGWLGAEKISIYEGSEITQETLREILKAVLLYYKESPSEKQVKITAYRGSYQETSWWDKAYMEVGVNDEKWLPFNDSATLLIFFLFSLFSSSLFFGSIPFLGESKDNEWYTSQDSLFKRSMVMLSQALLQGLVFSLFFVASFVFTIFASLSSFLLSLLILFLAFSLARGLYHFMLAKRDGSKWNPIKPEMKLFTLLLLCVPVALTFFWWPLAGKMSQESSTFRSDPHVLEVYENLHTRVDGVLSRYGYPSCEDKTFPTAYHPTACYRQLFYYENRGTKFVVFYYLPYRPYSVESAAEAMEVYSDYYRQAELKAGVKMRFYFRTADEMFHLTLKLQGDKR